MGKNETYLTKNQISCELGRWPLDRSSCRTGPSFRPVRLPSGPGPCVPAVDPADPAAEISRVSGVASHLCSRFLCSGPGFPLGDSSGQYLDLLSPRPCACGAEKPSKCLVDFCAKSEPLSVAQEALPGPAPGEPFQPAPVLCSLLSGLIQVSVVLIRLVQLSVPFHTHSPPGASLISCFPRGLLLALEVPANAPSSELSLNPLV